MTSTDPWSRPSIASVPATPVVASVAPASTWLLTTGWRLHGLLYIHELPRSVRFVLRPTGALNRSGSNLASYLLFEQLFCRALVDLGYQDTVAREQEVRDFFDLSEGAAHG